MWCGARSLVQTALAHDLPKVAASLTYFTVLSLLPALIVVVALLGVIGLSSDAVHTLLETLGGLGAPWAAEFVSDALDSVVSSQSSGIVLIVSLLGSLWAASAYVGAFTWASNTIYGATLRLPFWKGLPLRVALALLLLTLLTAGAAVITLVGPFGDWLFDLTGAGAGPLQLWSWIKWPLLIGLGLLLFTVLYRFAPTRRQPAIWQHLPGAAVGVVLWGVASLGFSIYLDHFASYNRVYGALGAVVAFLVWAWIMNLALLVGVEVNREFEERRGGGHDARPGV
jgi:membrane protein